MTPAESRTNEQKAQHPRSCADQVVADSARLETNDQFKSRSLARRDGSGQAHSEAPTRRLSPAMVQFDHTSRDRHRRPRSGSVGPDDSQSIMIARRRITRPTTLPIVGHPMTRRFYGQGAYPYSNPATDPFWWIERDIDATGNDRRHARSRT